MRKGKIVWGLILTMLCLFSGCTVVEDTPEDPADVLRRENTRDIYFATGNDYYDLYVEYTWTPGPEITLLSREYIDPESISVTVDIQADYTVYVTEHERSVSLASIEIEEVNGIKNVNFTPNGTGDFPLYLYQTYAGLDWAEVGALYTQCRSIQKQVESGETEASRGEEATAAYYNIKAEYASEYMELTTQDIPRYYEYLIQIAISDVEEEEILRAVQVSVGDTVYDVDIGEIHVRPSPGYDFDNDYLSFCMSSPLWLSTYPYGKGIEKCQSAVYRAEEPLTLTGLDFMENTLSTVKILDVTVVISHDEDQNMGIEIQWDGETPIYVAQGEYVSLHFTVQDDRMKEIQYRSELYPVLEFEHDGATYEMGTSVSLYRYYTAPWLLYAIGLDGLDMESYFNDYYYVAVSNWHEDVDQSIWNGDQ